MDFPRSSNESSKRRSIHGDGRSSSIFTALASSFPSLRSDSNSSQAKRHSQPALHNRSTSVSSASSSPYQVHWEGSVRKKGDWLPRWEQRYLVLDNATLTYYNSKAEARSGIGMRGRMILSKVREENHGKAHGFCIETVGHKCFHLCCSTELEKKMWIEMMQAAIDEGVTRALRSSNIALTEAEAMRASAPVYSTTTTNTSTLTSSEYPDSAPPSTTSSHIDLRGFYSAFRQLLISHSNSPEFFPKLSQNVVLCSNYAPTVPFWGEYHGLEGVLHFFSILYETVEFREFVVTDIAQAEGGHTAVIAGRETMKNRQNGRKFTQQWQHTIEFASDGRVQSLTITADPVAASAVFGSKATSSLSLPMATVVGNSNYDNPAGTLRVHAIRGEQLVSPEAETMDKFFLGMHLAIGSQSSNYAPTSSKQCDAITPVGNSGEDPIWNSHVSINFPGASKGKPSFMLIEAWGVPSSNSHGNSTQEELIGIAKVNLIPFLALASNSKEVRDSVIYTDIARGAVPQWYTLLSNSETKVSCGRVQLSISFEAAATTTQAGSRIVPEKEIPSQIREEVNEMPGVEEKHGTAEDEHVDPKAVTPSLRPVDMAPRRQLSKQLSYRDTRRDNHSFRVGNTSFDIPRRYQMIKAVGQGAYGCVIAASDTETGQALAIKNVPNAFNDLIDAKRILREIRLMKHLHHPNLVNLVDLIRPPSLKEFNDVYIVTDLMETDLHRVIHSNQTLTDEHIQYFVYQMLLAMYYMHSANVLHRDLKPSNILLNSDCDLKICDFGLARGVRDLDEQSTEEQDQNLTEYVVTRWYRAPELLLSSKYNRQMDVWSIGCILGEMLGRRPLFPGHDYLHQLKIIMDVVGTPSDPSSLDFVTNPKAKRFVLRQPKKPKVPLRNIYPRASPGCLDLLDKMLQFNPNDRITIEQALDHEYLRNVRDTTLEIVCEEKANCDFERCQLTKRRLQELMFEDVCFFHPEALEEESEKEMAAAHGSTSSQKMPSGGDGESLSTASIETIV